MSEQLNRNDIRLSIDAILANKATMPSKDRQRLATLLRQLEMAWHDYGKAIGERDAQLLSEVRA